MANTCPEKNHSDAFRISEGSSNQKLMYIAMAVMLVLLTAIGYQQIVDGGFYLDDYPNILDRDAIRVTQLSIDRLYKSVREAEIPTRIIPNISLAIDWWRGHGEPSPFLQTNLALHLVNVLLVAWLLMLAIGRGEQISTSLLLWSCFAGAALWALHPIQVQAVSYIVQRMSEMAALFSLATLIAYLQGRRSSGTRRRLWYGTALLTMVLGALSKENAWITPLLIWLAEFGICRHRQALLQRPADRFLLAIPALLLAYGLWDLAAEGPLFQGFIAEGYDSRDFTLAERLLTQPRVLLFHISQLLWPLPERFSLEHDFSVSRGLLSPPATLPALAVVIAWCLAGIALLLSHRHRLAGFFMLWPPVTLMTESSVIPLEIIFEHRLYLPLLGFAGLAALGIIWLFQEGRTGMLIGIIVPVCTLGALLVATHQRVELWNDPIRFYQNITRHAPGSARAWNNLGLVYANAQRYQKAESAFTRALGLDVTDHKAWGNRGKLRGEIAGREAEALADLNKALAIHPDHTNNRLTRANLLTRINRRQAALLDYNHAIRIRPGYALSYNNRGLLHLTNSDITEALSDFNQALTIEPANGEFLANRGSAYLIAGDMGKAIADLEQARDLQPEQASLHYNLGIAHRRSGNPELAAQSFAEACRLGMKQACQ